MGSTIEVMNWIFTYQYELMYSFGALFALFSMLSYVKPASHFFLENDKLEDSENFFEGFDEPDIESVVSGEVPDEVSVASFGAAIAATQKETVIKTIEEAKLAVDEEIENLMNFKYEDVEKEIFKTALDHEPKPEPVIEAKSESESDFEEDDDVVVVDYFSQSNLDVEMSIEEEGDEKQSATSFEENSIVEPVVDGFAKVAAVSPVFGIASEESTESSTTQEFKVSEPNVKKDVLIMNKDEETASEKDVLSMQSNNGEVEND